LDGEQNGSIVRKVGAVLSVLRDVAVVFIVRLRAEREFLDDDVAVSPAHIPSSLVVGTVEEHF